MYKEIFYLIYAVLFYLYSAIARVQNRVTFIMTHEKGLDGNIGLLYKEIVDKDKNIDIKFVTKENKFKLLFITPIYLATSKYIFLDNTFLPMAYIKFSEHTKVIQLWHGCNTLKKFGQLANKGRIKRLEQSCSNKYTHVIVSSDNTKDLHAKAFGVGEEKVISLGLPRSDIFFDLKEQNKEIEKFFEEYPELKSKKIILYAPTFRDNASDNYPEEMNLENIMDKLDENIVIALRLHPSINQEQYSSKNPIIDFSRYNNLNRLLLVSDMLITDYSSIIFEYALLKRPMIFYAYDYEEYNNSIRGFYYNYKEIVPGPIVSNKTELVESIKSAKEYDKIEQFNKMTFEKYTIKSSERIYQYFFSEKE